MRSKTLPLLALLLVVVGLGILMVVAFMPEPPASPVTIAPKAHTDSPTSDRVNKAAPVAPLPDAPPSVAMNGIVVETDGSPAVGAEVWAYSIDEPRDFGTATSGPDGTFSIGGLGRSRYWVAAKLGEDTALEQTAHLGTELRLVLAPRANLQVSVVDLDGALVPDAKIELTIAEKFRSNDIADELVSILNDAPAALEPGVFYCNLGLRTGYQASANSRSSGTGVEDEIFLLAGNAITTVEVTVLRGQTISGRVVDSLSRPIENVDIVLKALDEGEGQKSRYDLAHAGTDTDGTFRVGPVPPGFYRLEAFQLNFATSVLSPVEVYSMRPTDGLQIILLEGGSISVRYLRNGEEVVGGVGVSIDGYNYYYRPGLAIDGEFLFDHLPDGPYLIVATEPNNEHDTADLYKGVELTNGEHLEVVFNADEWVRLSGTLHGLSPDEQSLVRLRIPGGPVPPAVFSNSGPTPQGIASIVSQAIVRRDGEFELMGVSAGSYLLEIFHILENPTQEDLDTAVPVITKPITVGTTDMTLDLTLP